MPRRRLCALGTLLLVLSAALVSRPARGADYAAAPAISQQDSPYAQPGDYVDTLTSDGLQRRFLLHVPPRYDPAVAAPLVVSFHGYLDTPDAHADYTGLVAKADAEGFVVAFPQGQGDPPAWYTYSGAGQDWPDDVLFVRELITHLRANLNIDPRRIFATGISNGGGMAHRVGCDLSDVVAAIAPVAGNYVLDDPCAPLRPVPVMAIHGRADQVTPYDGLATLLADVPGWARDWAARNECHLTPERATTATQTETFQSTITIATFGDCAEGATVKLYTYDRLPHAWPVATAADFMWDFFVAHPLPAKYADGALTPAALARAPERAVLRVPPGDYVGLVPQWERNYLVHVPPGYDGVNAVPLLVSFHDFASDPVRHARTSGLSAQADTAGFLVVYPGGSGDPLAFYSRPDPPAGFPDDVTMTRDLIAYLSTQFRIDPDRIYVSGFSLGGGMAHRVACDLADVVDGAVMVGGGVFSGDACTPSAPVPVMAIHQLGDVTVGLPAWAADWAARNACTGDPEVTPRADGGSITQWTDCAAPVVLVTLPGADHRWPEAATPLLWDFLATPAP